MHNPGSVELARAVDQATLRRQRKLGVRLYGRRRSLLPTVLELAVLAFGAAAIWAAVSFDRSASSGALFVESRPSVSESSEVRAKPPATSPGVRIAPANITTGPMEDMRVRIEPTVPALEERPADKTWHAASIEPLPSTILERAPALQPRAPYKAEVEAYLRRASELVALGDVSAARLMLFRAAEGKDSRALVALAETYDPVVLKHWRVVGMRPDPDKARALYQQALELGSKTAGDHLLALK
jgi:hypothetical protein